MKTRGLLFLLGFLLILTACSVEIYDLQPIIIGTNTPTPTQQKIVVYVSATPTPRIELPTATPPVHLAPTEITSAVSVNILEIHMMDGGTGWGIGRIPNSQDSLVLRTTDGGNTWKNVTPSQVIYDNAGEASEVSGCFRDQNHAWLIFITRDSLREGIQVWYTEDGGGTWSRTELPLSGYTVQFFTDPKIAFLDLQTGWIFARIGQNEGREFIGLYTTYDGGLTWAPMVTSGTANLPSLGRKNGAVFRDTLEGWISGESTSIEPDAVLWHTFDGGNSWYKQQLPAPYGYNIPDGLLSDPAITCSFETPKFVDMVYVCAWSVLKCSGGSLSEPVSILYWSYDRLSSWQTYRLPSAEGDLSFYGIEVGWYAIQNPAGSDFPYEILFTENGGANWRTIASLAWDSRLQFITPAIGYAIATYQGMPALVRTNNSGFDWEQLFPMIMP